MSDICAISFTSARKRWKWSAATSPVWPVLILPGVCANESQIDSPRRPSIHPPSTWYAEVDVPHANEGGKEIVSESAAEVVMVVRAIRGKVRRKF